MNKELKKFFNANHISLDNKLAALYKNQCPSEAQVCDLLEYAHVHVFFDTTYACDLSCNHCIYSAGSNTPLDFIPVQDVSFLVKQARTEHEHVCAFALFGGEPTLAEIHNNGYFKTVADTIRNNNSSLRMSTNGNWINGEHADYLIQQLVYIYKTVPRFQLQISVDRFHKNSVQSATNIIQQLDNYQEIRGKYPIVIRGFKFDKEMAEHFNSMETKNLDVRTYFNFKLIPSGRASSLTNLTEGPSNNLQTMVLGNDKIPGNIALTAIAPCGLCNRFQIELHFTPDYKVFAHDALDYHKYITDAKKPDGTYKTYRQIKRDIAKSIFARYQQQIKK
jgi:hypothetical protein